ncbi:MAG TPA: GNAT family N-acetyltransferase [Blastocatellia bacterium]|jgi:ribosomal-protein-alanine N-acetyltransferase|nr:GNAT family N-acetyltransferase [Blastocatellia bacterium]
MELLEIITARLRLRPFVSGDVDEAHRLWIDPGVRKYLWDDEVISKEQAGAVIEESLAHFRDTGSGLWAASARPERGLLGFCGYWFFRDPPELELLYGVETKHWGKGIATEMSRAIIRYGFQELALDHVVASTDAPNVASVRVMEKSGMSFAGRETLDGLDTIFYSMAREQFTPGEAPYELRRYARPASRKGE